MASRESIRSSAYNPLDAIAVGKWKIRLLESMILNPLSRRGMMWSSGSPSDASDLIRLRVNGIPCISNLFKLMMH